MSHSRQRSLRLEKIWLKNLSKADKLPVAQGKAVCLLCFLLRFLELAAELCEIDAVLRGFVSADENDGNIPAIFLGQFGIQIDIHLA